MAKFRSDVSPGTQPVLTRESVKQRLEENLLHGMGKDPGAAQGRDWFLATAALVRGLLAQRRIETARRHDWQDGKRVYYLSMEFLLGRLLTDALRSLGLHDVVREALADVGHDLETLADSECDAALGNGGLGRLAACLLDSMATVGLPGYGYGIRYEYGMFRQQIEDGWQVEQPDDWLRFGNPWEFPRPELHYPVSFYGRVETARDRQGRLRQRWVDTEDMLAVAQDVAVPGFRSETVNTLRLWSAKAKRELDLGHFNNGDHARAVEHKNRWENLSRVLYPNDVTVAGQQLRLKQQYFFVSASIQDILREFMKSGRPFAALPDKVAIHINDTHPALGIAELMRLLVDVHLLDWSQAWSITQRTFAYTNHTLMPEALESWPLAFFEEMLPRHLQIIYEINDRFLREAAQRAPDDPDLPRRVSLIDERGERRVRMAHLAFIGSHKVNGVSEVHTGLMKETVFADFDRLFPDRIVNVTNGVTPRRWLDQANPGLARLISGHIGQAWKTELTALEALAPLAGDSAFRRDFQAVKRANKERLAAYIGRTCGIEVNVNSLFDVQIKRIHEYKRQLLNLLHVVTLYNRLRSGPAGDLQPRTVILAGKAAPGYATAKLIIKLTHAVAKAVNSDPAVGDRLKLVFVPNYGVSAAEVIIPAADLSEQISTAGTEASGTGNMKLALNGALTIGTLDGANIEMREAVGAENFFTFGLTVDDIAALHAAGYDPVARYQRDPELKAALDLIAGDHFSPEQPGLFRPIVESLTQGGDRYLLLADYAAYLDCQRSVDAVYRDPEEWTRRAILNVARMGGFSSDRAVRDYAETIWEVEPDIAGGHLPDPAEHRQAASSER
ncbi:glycogen/starch/alpha-glucan phosphorylase [Rhodospirillaceae bacterium SYSU D60014]|uniref:glycogen/starch/alpha-glucan phosphorylase n=1 Tax=Virgifigura deserti TaxID=2268457 RepID=UPI000E6709A7